MTDDPQREVDRLLEEIRTCLSEIEPLRKFVATVEEGMVALSREVQRVVGSVQEEQGQLKREIATLRLKLRGDPPPSVSRPGIPQGGEAVDWVTPPPPVETGPSSLPTRATPWAAEKRALADHIYLFMGVDQKEVIKVINGVLTDKRYGLGDMLELLGWGADGYLWRARPEGESVAHQLQRLQLWHGQLATRRDYWEGRRRDLLAKSEYATWEMRQTLTDEAWAAWLDGEVQKVVSQNTRLHRERDTLRRELGE